MIPISGLPSNVQRGFVRTGAEWMSGEKLEILVRFVQSQLSEWRLDEDARLQIVPVRADGCATRVVHKNTSGFDHQHDGGRTVITVASPPQLP